MPEPPPATGAAVPWPRRRRVFLAIGALLVAGAVAAGAALASGLSRGGPRPRVTAFTADGLRHTPVEVSDGSCGRGWSHPAPGQQVFDLRNTSTGAEEVYLTDPGTGAVHGEVEGLAPGTSRPMQVTLGNGSYAFRCVPDDADAVTGPTVRVTGAIGRGGPAAVPVTQQDLIPPTLAYQRWIRSRLTDLLRATGRLRDAVDRGDLAAARADWLPAHLGYERMGAAYGTFGAADGAVNGSTAGLAGGVRDPRFTGFHRIEYGLWHGQSAAALRGPADRLVRDVRALRAAWPRQRMDPAESGLRAHEILENTVQFELTARTDYGSGTNLATARANLDGTRILLGYLRPVLKTRDSGLPALDAWVERTRAVLSRADHDGHWTPLARLSRAQRERIDADMGELVERLADVAALTDVRRTG